MTRWSATLIKSVAAVLCIYIFFTIVVTDRNAYRSTQDLIRASRHRLTEDTTYDHIKNETLGFEKIYAIGLKERTDKRDFLTLAASVHGMKVKWLDGKFDISFWKPTVAACWRAHMNALRDVVENGYGTALIMEDDADWDVSVREQLREFARGVRTLSDNPNPSKDAPYGTNWDMLWVGGCASGAADNETDIYAIPNDPTTPSVKHRGTWGGPSDGWKAKHPELPEDSTRYIYRANMGCCLYGYAVTLEGARRILAALSVDYLDMPVDNAMSDLCAGKNRPHLRCYAPFPNLIGTYKPAGGSSRDSDIETYDSGDYHPAMSWNMVYSTRLNIHHLVAKDDTIYSQWQETDDPWSKKKVILGDMEYPGGFLVPNQDQ
ncbi:conserved hypothetical protein [Aspergillus terreus NIH2624]|uniref:LPS glycosyltransferase n=1 Tax=Aspergillus terreus (strain NIH 2624 / FGSC A1156) TaxID=341663 RepID=Q0CX53_ASPTN|nr:uncharacterized protein ATEG_01731 [Aspergillus terreus NIH2624]EAU38488.1 conserved hypothetical protein [Aspergillus terreus NIH2624]